MAARPPRVARAAVAVTVGLVLVMLGACGDDGDRPGAERSAPRTSPRIRPRTRARRWPTTGRWPDGVTVEATAAPGGDHVAITVTVTNTDGATIAVPDPATTPDRVGEAPDGTVRVSYLAVEAASDDGEAAPTGEGLLIAPGASHQGVARALDQGEEVPETLDVCVEVIADVTAADVADDGRVRLPARPTVEAPTVACSGPVPVE